MSRRNLKAFAEAPRCGAKRKYDGQPCQNPGTGTGGRCRFHGGRTPTGDNWHKPRWPDKNSVWVVAKLRRKLAALQKLSDARARRVARMSPDQRQKYKRWLSSHRSTSAADREVRRRERAVAREFSRTDQEAKGPPQNDEVIKLKKALAELKRSIAEMELAEAISLRIGVFG